MVPVEFLFCPALGPPEQPYNSGRSEAVNRGESCQHSKKSYCSINLSVSTIFHPSSVTFTGKIQVEMHFPWDKVLPKFIVLRVMRSTTKSGGSQSNSPVTRRAEGDCSVPAGIPSAQPGHFVSASSNSGLVVSSTGSSRAFSEAFDIAQVSLPVVQAAVEAIPIAGAPMKAAIGGLLAVLQAIDVSLL
jgi:hypothetical protein